MENWLQISLLLCSFGFFKEIRPSEPYLTQYLLGPWKNLTDVQVNHEIYPVWTYSYLSLLFVVFLVTDLLRYKPVIIIEGFSAIITWLLLIFGKGVPAMQAVEFFYGAFTATDVAYYTYIYAKVDKHRYQKVTSHTRTAYLMGRFMSGVLGQVLISTGVMDYYTLNFISIVNVSIATLIAMTLPSVKSSIYFHKDENVQLGDASEFTKEIPFSAKMKRAYSLLWSDFKSAYTNFHVVKWSVWWAFATCGCLQVLNYVQVLWDKIAESENDQLYNGAVEAIHTLVGAAAVLGCGVLRVNWACLGEITLAAASLVQGTMLVLMANTHDIWVAYVCYMVFGASYYAVITIASSEVAKLLKEDSYGLIFGINTFFALVLQTILTTVVVDSVGLALPIRQQFDVYGCTFFVLGAAFLGAVAFTAGRMGCKKFWMQKIWLPKLVKEEQPLQRGSAIDIVALATSEIATEASNGLDADSLKKNSNL